ncbi:hypothetical protein ACFLWN_01180, partial [Chloroflexota bacterium]
PQTPVWVSGVIVPKGACLSSGSSKVKTEHTRTGISHPDDFTNSWVIQGGELSVGTSLRDLFEKMGPKDVYIKGVNALDTKGTVGILIGNQMEGGTIGRVIAAHKRKGFSLIFPVGLEKLIPMPIEEAAKEALKKQYDYSMGINCGLLPCNEGVVVTELKAIEILTGATAIPIAAGGLDGAEGAMTLVVKGETEGVAKAIEYAEQSKGARLPKANCPNCEDCGATVCDFPVTTKPWVRPV